MKPVYETNSIMAIFARHYITVTYDGRCLGRFTGMICRVFCLTHTHFFHSNLTLLTFARFVDSSISICNSISVVVEFFRFVGFLLAGLTLSLFFNTGEVVDWLSFDDADLGVLRLLRR